MVRRKAAIKLTVSGQQKLREALPIAKHIYARNLEGLSEEESELLMTSLHRIKGNVFRSESHELNQSETALSEESGLSWAGRLLSVRL